MTTSIATPRRTRLVALIAAAVAAATLLVAGMGAATAQADSIPRESYVTSGGYRTLATLWNVNRKAEFQCPAGAKIRVLYGYGWLSFSRQEKTLDCLTPKRLEIGTWSKIGARIQIKVPQTGIVRWGYIIEGP
jgi:hypothetical protein